MASLAIAPTALSQVPLFTVVQLQHAQLDAAPSGRLQDLSRFKEEDIAVMYEGLLAQIDELHTAYAGLLSHLTIALEVSLETGSLFRKCFFLQHNLAAQFEMLGMNRCAHHSRDVESRLALVPPSTRSMNCQKMHHSKCSAYGLLHFYYYNSSRLISSTWQGKACRSRLEFSLAWAGCLNWAATLLFHKSNNYV